ncbi:unnamed protein product, partial [Prorocentrum cordatum]
DLASGPKLVVDDCRDHDYCHLDLSDQFGVDGDNDDRDDHDIREGFHEAYIAHHDRYEQTIDGADDRNDTHHNTHGDHDIYDNIHHNIYHDSNGGQEESGGLNDHDVIHAIHDDNNVNDTQNTKAPSRGSARFSSQEGRTQPNLVGTATKYGCDDGRNITCSAPSRVDASAASALHISVKPPDKKSINVDVNATATVDILMKLIQDEVGVPPDQQRFIYGGRQMWTDRRLSNSGVENESMVYLALNLGGGMEDTGSPHQEGMDEDTGLTQTAATLSLEDAIPMPPRTLSGNATMQIDHVALHADNIAAERSVARSLETWDPLNVLRSFEDVLAGFRMLGFEMDNPLPLKKIGLCWEEGPLPDESTVESQMRLSTHLLRAVAAQRDDPGVRSKCDELVGALTDSGQQRIQMLPSLRQARRRRFTNAIARYHEVELPFLQFLQNEFDEALGELVATQLPNQQGLNLATLACPPLTARLLHEQSSKVPARGAAAFIATGPYHHWLCWAPADAPSTGRWVSLLRALREEKHAAQISFLTPRPILPGRLSPAEMLDYGSPHLLQGQGGQRVQSMTFLEPPVRVLVEGQLGPRLLEQHLAIITLGDTTDGLPTPTIKHWNGNEAQSLEEGALILDFPTECSDKLLQLLRGMVINEVTSWSQPMASLSDRDGRRFSGVADGHTTMMRDPTALITDFTCPDAVATLPDHWEQLILLTLKKGVLITSTSASNWERTLTDQASAQRDARITKLTWRRSTFGGRKWVIPQAISKAATANRQGDWSGLTGPSRCTIHIQVKCDTSADPGPLMSRLTTQLSRCSGTSWPVAANGQTPRPGQIAPVTGEGGHWDGGVVAETADPAQAQAISKMLNGMCFAGE